MMIDDYFDELAQKRKGQSFAFLAERVPTSQEAPHRIAVAKPIKPEETVVLVLAGAVGKGKHINLYNGMLKKVDDFIKAQPEFENQNVRVCIAICDEGKYHHPSSAREILFHESWKDRQRINEIKEASSSESWQENTSPAYVQDIYDLVFSPKINACKANKEDLQKMLRSVNVVTFCHGSYTGLKLEKLVGENIKSFHLTEDERQQTMRQMLFLNYAPDVPVLEADSQFISIESAQDSHARYQPLFKEYFQMNRTDFGILRLAKNNSLMCAQVDKAGIEGNPKKVLIAKNIDDWFEEINSQPDPVEEPKEPESLGEHSFLGFKPVQNMSKGALKLQQFANNILKNGVLHSLHRPETPLPNVRHLAATTREQFFEFTRAWIEGEKQITKIRWTCLLSPKKFQQLRAFQAWHQNSRIELE